MSGIVLLAVIALISGVGSWRCSHLIDRWDRRVKEWKGAENAREDYLFSLVMGWLGWMGWINCGLVCVVSTLALLACLV